MVCARLTTLQSTELNYMIRELFPLKTIRANMRRRRTIIIKEVCMEVLKVMDYRPKA